MKYIKLLKPYKMINFNLVLNKLTVIYLYLLSAHLEKYIFLALLSMNIIVLIY